MKKILTVFSLTVLLLCGCSYGRNNDLPENSDEAAKDILLLHDDSNSKNDDSYASPEECFEAFLNNKIPVYFADGSELWRSDLEFDEDDLNCYRVGEQVDVDNDGEKEQLLVTLGGGFFLDCRNSELYVQPDIYGVEETTGEMTYLKRDDGYWIVYEDTLHTGREWYRILKYNGETKAEDIQIGKYEVADGEYEYLINSETVSEEAFLEAKNKYLGIIEK